MMKRRAAVLAAAIALTLPTASATAAAVSSSSHGAAVSAQAKAKAKPVKRAKPAKSAKPAKPAKPLKVAYAGFLTAVDASTITFTVKGGRDKALRGTPLTLTVPATARITRDDVVATLADLQPGDKVNVKTTRLGSVVTVTRVSAESPEPVAEPTPTPTPTPEPTETTE